MTLLGPGISSEVQRLLARVRQTVRSLMQLVYYVLEVFLYHDDKLVDFGHLGIKSVVVEATK